MLILKVNRKRINNTDCYCWSVFKWSQTWQCCT